MPYHFGYHFSDKIDKTITMILFIWDDRKRLLSLIMQCSDLLSPIICSMINLSTSQGEFNTYIKTAGICPSVDKTIKRYCVSNLTSIIERIGEALNV